MSREIKFAFWHKQKKEMWSAQSIDWDAREVCNGGDIASLNDGVLLQYTGLKDKNGKEIYEGDILKHIPTFEANYFVKNLTGGFYLCPNNKDYGEYFASLFAGYDHKNQCNSIEIIGNIYENPELLNKEGE